MKTLLFIVSLFIFSCNDGQDNKADIKGCIYKNAINFNEFATIDDGSCQFDLEKYPIPERKPKEILSKNILFVYTLFSLILSIILCIIIFFKVVVPILDTIQKSSKKIKKDRIFTFLGLIGVIIFWPIYYYLFKLIFGSFYSIPKIYDSILYYFPDTFFRHSADFFISIINYILELFK